MARRPSPFEFDISVSADKKRRSKRRAGSGAVESSRRKCDYPGCTETGQFRAPKAADRLDEFYWFCKDHIREYNTKWNFFENYSEQEIEDQVKSDQLGNRPTWKLGTNPEKPQVNSHTEGRAWQRFGFNDPFEALGENATMNRGASESQTRRTRTLPQTERRALEILGGEDSMTKPELRKVYKSLVKDLHPDMNGGSHADEDRLQEVVWAWDQIKGSRSFKD